MKKQAYTTIAILVFFGCGAISTRAQCTSNLQSRANIPFQFSAGQTILPAGDYVFTCYSDAGGVLIIRSTDGRKGAFLTINPVDGKAENRSRLVFRRYGNQYFLAEAWAIKTRTGFELPKSRAERIAERDLAPIVAKREEVVLTRR